MEGASEGFCLEDDAHLPPKKRARKPQGPHKRYWFFTDNGEAGKHGTDLVSNPEVWKVLPDGVAYLTWQLEVGTKTSHPHLQGHLQLVKAQYVSWIHKHVSSTATLLVRKGNTKQCDVYCHKLEGRLAGPWTLGVASEGSGSRTDLAGLVCQIKQGASWKDLIEDDPNLVYKYDRFISRLKSLFRPKYAETGEGAKVILLFGEAGCGKTRAAFAHWKDGNFFELALSGSSTLWWDGLDRHSNILLDDFTGASSHMRLDVLLKILDRYPRRVPIKGNYEWLVGDKHIIITSNIHPYKWYSWIDREAQWLALARRIHKVFIWKYNKMIDAPESFWDVAPFATQYDNHDPPNSYGFKRNLYPVYKF